MKELVQIVKNEVFTSSLIIAEGTGNQHESIQRRIRNYEKELSTFGQVGFEIRSVKYSRGTNEQKIYLLNEQQATFLITLLKNTKVVVDFKLELVRQFYEMRQYILEHQSTHWQQTRLESKTTRKMETDEIKQLVEYAKKQGSEHAERYYTLFSKLANKAIGIKSAQREQLSVRQLNNLTLVEQIIGEVIKQGMAADLYYKEIYKACSDRLGQFQAIAYLA